MTVEQRQLALRLRARGLSLGEIGPQAGCSHQGGALVVRQVPRRPVRHDDWVPGPGRLTLADREEITLGLHADDSFTAIAVRLGKPVSTVSREVATNDGRKEYRTLRAHQRARDQARRPKTPKLASPKLAAQVCTWLEQWWSPVQISRRLWGRIPGRSSRPPARHRADARVTARAPKRRPGSSRTVIGEVPPPTKPPCRYPSSQR